MNQVYKVISERLVRRLRQGEIPWRKAFLNGDEPRGYAMPQGECYKGLNRILLPLPGEYLTRNQVEGAGGRVLDEEDFHIASFFRSTGEADHASMYYYKLFHISNVEGVRPHEASAKETQSLQAMLEAFLRECGLTLSHLASDEPMLDTENGCVVMPVRGSFANRESYYWSILMCIMPLLQSAVFQKPLRTEVEDYSKEKLAFEATAALIMSRCGLDAAKVVTDERSSAEGWADALSSEKNLLYYSVRFIEKASMLFSEPETMRCTSAA